MSHLDIGSEVEIWDTSIDEVVDTEVLSDNSGFIYKEVVVTSGLQMQSDSYMQRYDAVPDSPNETHQHYHQQQQLQLDGIPGWDPSDTKQLSGFACIGCGLKLKLDGSIPTTDLEGAEAMGSHADSLQINASPGSRTNTIMMPYQSISTELHVDRKFACENKGCTKMFPSKATMQNHFYTHGPRIYACVYCSKAFVKRSTLKRHYTMHTGERQFQCPAEGCGLRFAQNCNLNVHMRTHTGERPYACTIDGCNKAFKQSSNQKRHILAHTKAMHFHHLQQQQQPQQQQVQLDAVPGCDPSDTKQLSGAAGIGCGLELKVGGSIPTTDLEGAEAMRSHADSVQMNTSPGSTEPRVHACIHCGKEFVKRSILRRHYTMHTSERPFQCPVEGCGVRFAQICNLNVHMRTHTGERPYACTIDGCNKAFKQSSNRKRHILTHTKENV